MSRTEYIAILKAQKNELWQWLLVSSIADVGLDTYRLVKEQYNTLKEEIETLEKEQYLVEDGHVNND